MIFLQAGCNQVGFEGNIQRQESFLCNALFIAEAPIMKNLYKKIQKLAGLDTSVLILGSAGTGCKSTAYEFLKMAVKTIQKSL